MAVALADRKRTSSKLQSWLDDVSLYERAFKKYETRVEGIIKRYRDENRSQDVNTTARFNILWSNVQTLTSATFARIPKPDVSRRFRDNDPTGRVASLILERGLEYMVDHYPEYASTLKMNVNDRFLGGRGTSWIRYEPHFLKPKQPSGDQVTDAVDEPDEELDYECVTVDYVYFKDYGHSVARTQAEVTRRWRKVYMTREALVERFGKEKGDLVPLDASAKETNPSPSGIAGQALAPNDAIPRACVYEGWDKAKAEAVWFSKSLKDFLDTLPDPLGLEEFFPSPAPIYSTLTSETLVPVPDFVLYQDQANELDILADRIDGLVKALKVMGVYDASVPALARLLSEGENNSLIPVKNWAAFSEKNGLKGTIDLVDLRPFADALKEAYLAFEQVKAQVYEITGISDIIRGQSEASETATAQRIKGQYASLKLKSYQHEVAQYATEILQIMAQIMCRKFSRETLLKISAADQLSPADQQFIEPAMALLMGERATNPDAENGPNPVRDFRIEIAADSLIQLDEATMKEERVEFIGMVGTYFQKLAEVMLQMPPEAKAIFVPLAMDILKFGVTGFKVGKTIEGQIDAASQQLADLARQPPPPAPPDPALQLEHVKAEAETKKAQMGVETAQVKGHLAVQTAAQKAQIEQRKMQAQEQHDTNEFALDQQRAQLEVAKAHAMPQRPQGRPS